jgi:Ca2+-binding EF-hand superfamily protein
MGAGDKSSNTAASPSGDSGAESMFKAMDKNNDGSISREEAKGTPHEKEFAALDKNNDGKLSREEHAAAPAHAGDKRPATTSSGTPAPSGKQPK